MKLKSIVLAAGLIAVPAFAMAQSSPSPNNQSGPSVSPSVQAPTDQGAGNATGNTKGTPERRANTKTPRTTGVKPKGMNSTRGQYVDPNASPASPNEGAKKESGK